MASPGSDFGGSAVTQYPAASGGAMVPAAPPASPAPLRGLPSQAPEILVGGFNQTWLYNCLRRRWLLSLLMGTLLGGLTALLLLWLFPESHSTMSTVQVEVGRKGVFNDKRMVSPSELEMQRMSQLSRVKADFVLRRALSDPEISSLQAVRNQGTLDNGVQWMIEDLQASFPNDGDLMLIKYDGEEDPAEMQKVVDAIVKSYIDEAVYREQQVSKEARNSLDLVLRELQGRLKQKMNEYERLVGIKESTHSPTAEFEVAKLQGDLRTIETSISKLKEQLVDVEVFKQVSLTSADSPTALDAAIQETLAKDPQITSYEQQLFTLQQELMQLESISRNPNSNDLRRRRIAVEQTRQMLDAYRSRAEREIREQMKNVPKEGLRAAMAEYQIRKNELTRSLDDLEKLADEKNRRILELGTRDTELDLLKAEIENMQETETELAYQLRGREVDAKSEEGNIAILNKANSIPEINTIERYSIAGVGGLGAFMATVYGVALMEFRRRRLNGPQDLDEGLGIPVLGVLPSITARKSLAGSGIVVAQAAEAIDGVRASIMHHAAGDRQQVLMVVCPDALEGGTTVAVNLARSLARAGRRTLLVDGDLRAPALHQLFGLPLEGGVSELLRSEMDVVDAVKPTADPSLYLLTAGVCDAAAVHALATDQPQPIFDQLRSQFDFVIIDAPPVLTLADSLSIGQYVDGAILAVLRDHSEIRHVHKAAETLQTLGIRLLGSVVNGVSQKVDRRVARLHRAGGSAARQLPDPKVAARGGKASKAKDSGRRQDAGELQAPPSSSAAPDAPVAGKPAMNFDLDEFDIDLDVDSK